MAEFAQAYQGLNLPLIVLPPSQPKYNGGVERRNRIFKKEFYYCPDPLAGSIGAMRFGFKKTHVKYNPYRPHKNLGSGTPMAYIQSISAETISEAQIW